MTLRFTGTCDAAAFAAACAANPYWYHSFYFDNGFAQPGDYDIGRDIASYGFPEDLTGLSVLDVGTGSGWFAVYFEQRGADVTTLDVRGHCDHDVFGRPGYPDVSTEKPGPDRVLPDGRPIYYSHSSQGFWILKDLLSLRAAFVNARIYDICPELFGGRQFDLVFVGSVLMHVRDPIGALMAVRSVCRRQVIATSWELPESSPEAEPPSMRLLTDVAPVFWWQPNRACLRQWFVGAGFPHVEISRTIPVTADAPLRVDALKPQSHRQTLIHARV